MSRIVSSVANWLTRVFVLLSIPIGAAAADRLQSAVVDGSQSASTSENTDPGGESATDRPLPVIGIAAGENTEQGLALAWALRQALDSSIEWKSAPVGRLSDGIARVSATAGDHSIRLVLPTQRRLRGRFRFALATPPDCGSISSMFRRVDSVAIEILRRRFRVI